MQRLRNREVLCLTRASTCTPILEFQSRDAGELAGVRRYKGQVIAYCLRCDPKIIPPNYSAAIEQLRPNLTVDFGALFIDIDS